MAKLGNIEIVGEKTDPPPFTFSQTPHAAPDGSMVVERTITSGMAPPGFCRFVIQLTVPISPQAPPAQAVVELPEAATVSEAFEILPSVVEQAAKHVHQAATKELLGKKVLVPGQPGFGVPPDNGKRVM